MTTTEDADRCTAANGPCGEHDCWHNPMGDPMVDWLTANGIALDRLPMWPEIQLLPGRMLIEFIYGHENDPPRTRLILRRPSTRMVERPTPVPMPVELWEAYQRGYEANRIARALEMLGDAGATVLSLKPGSSLVLVCSAQMSGEDGQRFLETASQELRSRLPEVDITIMTGVDTILHRAAP